MNSPHRKGSSGTSPLTTPRGGNSVAPRPLLVDIGGAAELLAVSERLMDDFRRDGVIPSVVVGKRLRRFRVADLESFVAGLPSDAQDGRADS